MWLIGLLPQVVRRMVRLRGDDTDEDPANRVFALNMKTDVDRQGDEKRKAQSAAAGNHTNSQCSILYCGF